MDDYIMLLPLGVVAGLVGWWGWSIGANGTTAGKGWFLGFIALIFLIASTPGPNGYGEGILYGGIAGCALFGFLYAVAEPLRTRNTNLRSQKRRERQRLREIRAANPGTDRSQIGLKRIVIQTASGVATYVICNYFFGFGTTEASISSVATAAILGLVFRFQT